MGLHLLSATVLAIVALAIFHNLTNGAGGSR